MVQSMVSALGTSFIVRVSIPYIGTCDPLGQNVEPQTKQISVFEKVWESSGLCEWPQGQEVIWV